MKARITKAPERVLTYGIDPATRPLLSAALEELGIEERGISPDQLGQTVGWLAGFPGFSPDRDRECPPPPSIPVLCMCGLSGARVNALLAALRKRDVHIPLKAVSTPTNQNWTFLQLIEELKREHTALTGSGEPASLE